MQPAKPDFSASQLRKIIIAELAEHPKSRYGDLYKLLHQAYYGPTHIVPDPVAIATDIREEMAAIQTQNCGPSQDIGCGKGFVRLNLVALTVFRDISGSKTSNLLRDQLIRDAMQKVKPEQVELLTQSILASRLEGVFTLQDWQSIWKQVQPLVCEFIFPTFTERALIEQCLETGLIPPHSDDYRYLYKPHYRVIHHSHLAKFKTHKG
ncbi:MAG TPA: hypothetical protein PLU06_03050 [Candidatus Syntrophosphaera sp.]|jgi:hypothetical protein|nr:hypothetical protein [Candidatus Cloacimonadota bacterium]HPB43243.1 hypothetical protein [Candidatus Syntrophosphaera sp.]HQO67753.1 hypothetical protein [Candidatus Syntrophosphaera sp.]